MPDEPKLPGERFRSRLIRWSLLRLSELGKEIEYTRFERDPRNAKIGQPLEDGVILMNQVIDAFFGIAKTVADTDPRDLATLSTINVYVNGFLRNWDPEHDHPAQWEVDLYRERGDVGPHELAELEQQAARNEERAEAKREVERWRAISRFGLLWWIERQLRTTSNADYRPVWEAFAGYFGSVEETGAIVDEAITESRERHRWLSWVPTPDAVLQGDAIFSPSVEREFLRTFVLVSLRQIQPDAATPDLGLVPNISSAVDELEQYVREAEQNDAIAPLLPQERLNDRVNRLVEAVRRSRELGKQVEDERIIIAELNPVAVSTFEGTVREARLKARLLPRFLEPLGAYEIVESEEGEEVGEWLGNRTLQLKRWFVGDPAANLVDQMGREEGLGLAEGETNYFLDQADAAPVYARADAEVLGQALRAAIAEVRARGQELLVVVPFHWRWREMLDLTAPTRFGGNVDPPGWLSADLKARFAGSADGVPVVQVRGRDLSRVLVFAADTFVRWRQWRQLGKDEVHVSVTSWNEDDAGPAAAEHPDWFADGTPENERPRELRLRALTDVHEYLEIEIVDVQAGRWVELQDDELP